MQTFEFEKVAGVDGIDAPVLSVDKEPMLRRVPQIVPANCPHCNRQLFDGAPLTVRACLLRQLEAHKSPEPTATRLLCEKVATMPLPFQLEDAEMKVLGEAITANGAQYLDWVQGLLLQLVNSAVPLPMPEESTEGEGTTT